MVPMAVYRYPPNDTWDPSAYAVQLWNAGRPPQLPDDVGRAVARGAVVGVAVVVAAVVGVGVAVDPQGLADCPEPAIVLPSAISAPHTDQLVPTAGSSPQRPPFVFR
jgi:hypothetical protein